MPPCRNSIPVLAAVVATVAALVGCDRSTDLRAPIPEARTGTSAPTLLPASRLAAPVLYDLGPVIDLLEREIPMRFGDMEERHRHPGNDRIHVAFEVERGPFEWSFDGNEARLTAILRYRGRGWYNPPLAPEVSASCGTSEDTDDRPRARVTLASPLTVDGEWRLRSRVRTERIEAASDTSEDACTVTIFGIDVTERVLAAAERFLDGNADRIDARIAEVDLKGRLNGVWSRLVEAHELTDDVWLQLGPESVALGEVRGEGRQVRLGLELTAHPRIIMGPRPGDLATVLPPLTEGIGGEGLRILLEARAHYDEGAARISRELDGERFEWAGRHFDLRGITLRGLGDGRIALGVRFGGSARGEIFLVGTPELDHERREIHVPDLQFDIETLNLLMRSAAWIARGDLERVLREQARLPVDDVLTFAMEQLHRALNRQLSDEVVMEGEVEAAELLGVRATLDAILVHATAEARATLRVDATP